jgi:hypothetical protein
VAGLPPLLLATTSFQQFDPALGTLDDVQITLTGPFRWIPNQPGNTLSFTLDFGSDQIFFLQTVQGEGLEMANLKGTLIPLCKTFTGTSSINGLLDFHWGAGTTPNTSADAGVMALQGTVTYNYTPRRQRRAPEQAMMLLGFANLGFALRQSRRRISFP